MCCHCYYCLYSLSSCHCLILDQICCFFCVFVIFSIHSRKLVIAMTVVGIIFISVGSCVEDITILIVCVSKGECFLGRGSPYKRMYLYNAFNMHHHWCLAVVIGTTSCGQIYEIVASRVVAWYNGYGADCARLCGVVVLLVFLHTLAKFHLTMSIEV